MPELKGIFNRCKWFISGIHFNLLQWSEGRGRGLGVETYYLVYIVGICAANISSMNLEK